MTIEGVSNVEMGSDDHHFTSSSSFLPAVDMSLVALDSISMMDDNNGMFGMNEEEMDTVYGATNTNKIPLSNMNHFKSIILNITFDPNITGMRSISEWINDSSNTKYKCKILYDSSDLSQRKKK
eukprot:315400_1